MTICSRHFIMLVLLALNFLPPSFAQFSAEDRALNEHYLERFKYSIDRNLDKAKLYADSLLTHATQMDWEERTVLGLLAKAEYELAMDAVGAVDEHLETATQTLTTATTIEAHRRFELEAEIIILKANQYHLLGKTKAALSILDTLIAALEKLPTLDSKDSLYLRNSLYVAGYFSRRKGDYEKAFNYCDRARKWNINANAYQSFMIKILMAKKEYVKAEEDYRAYFQARKKVIESGEKNSYLSSSYRGFANLFLLKNQPDSALHYLQVAKRFIEQKDNSWPLVYYLEGKTYQAKGKPGLAIAHFEKALKRLKKSLPAEKSVHYAKYYEAMGEVMVEKGDLETGLELYQQALIQLVPDFNSKNIYDNPKLAYSNTYKELLTTLRKKTTAFYRLQQKEPNFVEATIATSLHAIDLIDSIRLRYSGEEDKQFLLEQSYFIFDKAIAIALDQKKDDLAFALSEKSKAVVLYEALKIKRAKAFSQLDNQLIIRKHEIDKAIRTTQKKLFKATVEAERRQCRLDLHAWKKQDALLLEEMKEDATFRKVLEEMSLVTVEKMAHEVLAPGQDMLEFHRGEEYLYAFLIRSGKAKIETRKILWTKDLDQMIHTFNDLIYQQINDVAYVNHAYQLYQILLAPFYPSTLPKQLVIIPDGELAYLPFSALLTNPVAPSAASQFKNHPYLIKKLPLCQWFSATSFVETQYKNAHQDWKHELLAYAPSFRTPDIPAQPIAERSMLFPLVFSKDEVASVAAELSGAELLVEGEEAHKEHFFEYAPQSKIIHFATHGKVNEAAPWLSYIAFSNANIPDSSDYLFKLRLDELYHTDLTAEMVVLSACETGIGKMVKGEGAISIARGFIYAGARSIITTLWRVSDKSTYHLMKPFYQALKAGETKDKALQIAMLHHLEQAPDPDRARPYHWAALTAIGNMNALDLDDSTFSKTYLLLLPLLLLLFLLFRRQQRA